MTVARGKQQSIVLLLATLGALLLMQSHAEAACSSPAGNPGDVFFSSVQNAMVYCNGTSWVAMGMNQVVNFGTLTTGDFCTATSGTAISCNTPAIAESSLSQIAGLSVLGNGTNATGNVTVITGTANQVLVVSNSGTALAFGAVNLGSSAAVSGILPIANGGTGDTSLTPNVIYKGNGTAAMSASSLTDTGSAVYTTENVGIGTTGPSNLLEIGAGALGTVTGNSVAVSNTSGNSVVSLGQTANDRLILQWHYNATASSAYSLLSTGAAAQPLILQSTGGNVGIGTTAPMSLLQIGGSTVNTAAQILFGKTVTTTDTWLPFIQETSVLDAGGGLDLALDSQDGLGGIVFYTGAPSTQNSIGTGSNVARMAITAAGNIGIGTTAPAYKLEVNGSTKIDSTGGNVPHACAWETEYGWGCSLPSPSGATNGQYQVWASCGAPNMVVMNEQVGYTATGGIGSSASWTDGNGYAGWTATFTSSSDENCRYLTLYCCAM